MFFKRIARMPAARKGILRLDPKMLVLLFLLALVAGYLLFSEVKQSIRRARERKAERGAEQAMAEAGRFAAVTPLPSGWRRETRQVTVVLPLANREKEINYFVNTVGMRFVPLPAGKFLMGQDDDPVFPDAEPAHWVRITRPFFMGAYEVTRAQYEAIRGKPARSIHATHFGAEPVYALKWDDALEFCRMLSQREGLKYRLPTEAEWEYACRAGTTTGTYTGSRDPKELNCIYYKPETIAAQEKYQPRFHPEAVGTFPANPFALFDMAGNVWEWCQDWYGRDYYASSVTDDPEGPSSGTMHVRRGGSYLTGRLGCRSYYRVKPEAIGGAGFRVVLPMDSIDPATN